jgi:hypothetical protein
MNRLSINNGGIEGKDSKISLTEHKIVENNVPEEHGKATIQSVKKSPTEEDKGAKLQNIKSDRSHEMSTDDYDLEEEKKNSCASGSSSSDSGFNDFLSFLHS